MGQKAKGKSKGKVLPITGYEGPEGEQMYSSTLPSTSKLDGGGGSAPRPGRFTPWKDPVPIVHYVSISIQTLRILLDFERCCCLR